MQNMNNNMKNMQRIVDEKLVGTAFKGKKGELLENLKEKEQCLRASKYKKEVNLTENENFIKRWNHKMEE